MRTFLSLSTFLFLMLNHLSAQEVVKEFTSPDDGFKLMRGYAEEQQYAKAISIAQMILTEDPDNFDVALYMARIYGWEAKYDTAYSIIENILSKDPDLFEAHEVLVDLAYWENDWVKLEQYSKQALELQPDAPKILERYLLARNMQRSRQDAPELFLHYYYDHFSLPYVRNWHMLTAGVNLPVKTGVLSPYVNAGYHAGMEDHSTDLQLNLDAYLNLGRKNYAMAGYGFSPNGVVNYLPRHRAAAEIWQVLPKGFALSAGLRYFYWEQHFTFLTISGEKYAGNYWFSLRNYIFFKEYGVSGSYYLSVRRYFRDKYNYLTCIVGYGTAPDEPLLVVSDLDRLNAISGRVEYSKQLKPRLRLNVMAGYAYEEYDRAAYRHRIDLRAGIYIRLTK